MISSHDLNILYNFLPNATHYLAGLAFILFYFFLGKMRRNLDVEKKA